MSNPRKSSDSTKDAVEALTILIESQGIDITANYSDWLRIAFALVDEFGLDGESYFHRISAFYPNYSHEAASQQYIHCLQSAAPSGKSRVTIATLFYIAKNHGINLPCPPFKGVPEGRGIQASVSIHGNVFILICHLITNLAYADACLMACLPTWRA